MALRYALGIALVQVYWTVMLLAARWRPAFNRAFVVAAVARAARAGLGRAAATRRPGTAHHIVERYGLMNMIVLGETLLAAVIATRAAIDSGVVWGELAVVRGLGRRHRLRALVALLHRGRAARQRATDARTFVWGYGHFLIFAAGAAVGAGFAVQVGRADRARPSDRVPADLAAAIPIAIYLFGLWLVRDRFCLTGAARRCCRGRAALALLTPLRAALDGGAGAVDRRLRRRPRRARLPGAGAARLRAAAGCGQPGKRPGQRDEGPAVPRSRPTARPGRQAPPARAGCVRPVTFPDRGRPRPAIFPGRRARGGRRRWRR